MSIKSELISISQFYRFEPCKPGFQRIRDVFFLWMTAMEWHLACNKNSFLQHMVKRLVQVEVLNITSGDPWSYFHFWINDVEEIYELGSDNHISFKSFSVEEAYCLQEISGDLCCWLPVLPTNCDAWGLSTSAVFWRQGLRGDWLSTRVA